MIERLHSLLVKLKNSNILPSDPIYLFYSILCIQVRNLSPRSITNYYSSIFYSKKDLKESIQRNLIVDISLGPTDPESNFKIFLRFNTKILVN